MEDFPSPSNKDVTYGITKGLIAAVPGIGGAVSELLALAIASPLEIRRSIWLNELASRLQILENKIDFNTLFKNDIFLDVVLTATSIAIKTSDKDKLKALQNAVVNSSKCDNPGLTKTQ